MSHIASSPLVALIHYHERLTADPTQPVPEYGFSREKIHLQAVLDRDGSLTALEDIRNVNDRGKPIPQLLLVPDGGGRSGIGLKPFFTWDNSGYVLGRDNKGNAKRAAEMFSAFRDLHLSMHDEVGDDEAYAALCRFLERWNPAKAVTLTNWNELAGLNVVFKLRGQEAFIHQSEAVKRAWQRRVDGSTNDERSGVRGASLITGEDETLARLHPLVSGVAGANTTGAAIVSFNLDAFTSYGKAQSYNSPVGIHDAFRYTTALNWLLADATHRARIGDATVVFWTDRAEAKEAEEVFAAIFGEEVPKDESSESGTTIDRLGVFLNAARQGRLVDVMSDPDAPFYVLGLSPNASRINLRFWLAGTVAQFAGRLTQHAADLEIIQPKGSESDPPLVIRRLLWETVQEPKDIPPQLAGEVARAVLGGLPYPQTLFSSVVRRVRADMAMNYRRAAILKAYLARNRNQEVPVALDKDHPEEAYHLGRLFAGLEKTQEDATEGKLSSTIKDRYFGAASATPASIFPRLLRLHQHHLDKIENPSWRLNRERLIGEICSHIRRFPPHMPLEKQGLFYVAYYHQRQDFFTKKERTSEETSDE